MTQSIITKIDVSKVSSVYSGKVNSCCCGCSGTHKYASAIADQGRRIRGYDIAADEVSDRSIKSIVNKVIKASKDGVEVYFGRNCASVDVGSRTYIVYFER